MKDLTSGSVRRHLLELSGFIAMSTVFQTLYFLADLYFVGRLGKEAIAGVGAAGNLTMVVLALTQTLGVGATSLVAQSMGRRDRAQAEVVFNQALVLSSLVGLGFGLLAFASRHAYSRALAADAATAAFGGTYLTWFVPALALQFPLIAMGAALRGLGDMKVPTLIQISTVMLNIALAPVLILGWGTGRPLGVAGAGIASLVALVVAGTATTLYLQRESSPIRIRRANLRPQLSIWRRILKIGVPAGGEFALISIYIVFVYTITRHVGAAAQAGFGIGARVMQALFLPAVAIGFAAAPVAGQNFGARQGDRVRQTFAVAATMSATVMLVTTLLCHLAPSALVGLFSDDPAVIAFGGEYLRIISWNFVATGVIFVSSSIFQGMGHTLPAFGSSALRLLVFAIPAYIVSHQAGFEMRNVWYIAVMSVFLQLLLNLWLLRREFNRRLVFSPVQA